MSDEIILNVPLVQISALSPKRPFCGPDERKEMSCQNHVLYTNGRVPHNREVDFRQRDTFKNNRKKYISQNAKSRKNRNRSIKKRERKKQEALKQVEKEKEDEQEK